MMTMFSIHLKTACRALPLLIFVLVCQLLLGQMSSNAISGKKPEMKIAVSKQDDGDLTERYIGALSRIEGLDIVEVGASTQMQNIFDDYSFIGFVEIPEYFTDYMLQGKSRAISFYPAPGVTDTTEIEEYLMTELAILRTRLILDRALSSLGAPPAEPMEATAEWEPILTLSYSGPNEPQPFFDAPGYGVPALFLLLAFLHSANTVMGLDNRRAVMRGNVLRPFLAGLIPIWLVWGLLVSAYLLGMRAIYDITVDLQTSAAMFALALYSASLGGLLAMTGHRARASLLFVPWFLLNMTLGGGLWGGGVCAPLLAPLFPVSQVLASSNEGFAGACPLLLCTALCLLVSAVLPKLVLKVTKIS